MKPRIRHFRSLIAQMRALGSLCEDDLLQKLMDISDAMARELKSLENRLRYQRAAPRMARKG